jgi:hypothetical protein
MVLRLLLSFSFKDCCDSSLTTRAKPPKQEIDGVYYDFAFPIEFDDGTPPLKLGYNLGTLSRLLDILVFSLFSFRNL